MIDDWQDDGGPSLEDSGYVRLADVARSAGEPCRNIRLRLLGIGTHMVRDGCSIWCCVAELPDDLRRLVPDWRGSL